MIKEKGHDRNTFIVVVFIPRVRWEPSSTRLWVWRGSWIWPSGSWRSGQPLGLWRRTCWPSQTLSTSNRNHLEWCWSSGPGTTHGPSPSNPSSEPSLLVLKPAVGVCVCGWKGSIWGCKVVMKQGQRSHFYLYFPVKWPLRMDLSYDYNHSSSFFFLTKHYSAFLTLVQLGIVVSKATLCNERVRRLAVDIEMHVCNYQV